MATLNSPGVSVTVVDESFYNPAAPGTVPLIFVASAANKKNSSATGTAAGTLGANAGKVWTITSQLDLGSTFGNPTFQTDSNGNPVNGGELNEYGLQAAHSLLGISSRAYVVRADIDLGQLEPQSSPVTGSPVAGTYWLNSANSVFGVSEWNATSGLFENQTLLIIDDTNKNSVAASSTDFMGNPYWTPNPSFGTLGAYAMVVTQENTNELWYKNSDNVWVLVGSNWEQTFSPTWNGSTCWQTSYPIAVSSGISSSFNTGLSLTVNGQSITFSGTSTSQVVSSINSVMYTHGVGARVLNGQVALYADASDVTYKGSISLSGSAVGPLGFTSTYAAVSLAIQPHTQVPQFAANGNPSGSVYIKTTPPNNGANWSVSYYNGATQTFGTVAAPIYKSTDAAIFNLDLTGGTQIPVGTLFVCSNYDQGKGGSTSSQFLAEFKVYRRKAVAPTTISYAVPNSFTGFNTATNSTFVLNETLAGVFGHFNTATVTIAPQPANNTATSLNALVTAISAAGFSNVSATYSPSAGTNGTITISHALGGDFKIADGTNSPLTGGSPNALGFNPQTTPNLYRTGRYQTNGYSLRASNWAPLFYQSLPTAPSTTPADGQLWYDSMTDQVDILYQNGTTWVGYLNQFPNSDPNGPLVSASAPTTQSDGTPLTNGDIWIQTSPIDSYGHQIYVYNGSTLTWVLQDPTDHTTPNGWLFADARWSTSGASSMSTVTPIKVMLGSNYLDPDAPDPALYPQGTRLWNTRRSGFNVKKYVSDYINLNANNGVNIRYNSDPLSNYEADRWVTASPNDSQGVGTFGRHAQRAVVVAALKSLIDTNAAVRDTDTLVFNLLACPGYPEAVQNLVNLNSDRNQTAFVVADTPFRLEPDATTLSAWGNNTNGALDNGDVGAVTYDDYTAFYYPSGYSNDNFGNYIVVPPSHMMLYTIANSDNVSYPWFAPAGLRRGVVQNATAVGYVDPTTDEFVQTSLYEGLRNVLAEAKVNPIATIPGSGLVVMGQYTRASVASSLDRINVARLVCYLRRQLEILARPFLFEPNDSITRSEIKGAVDNLLLELVAQRAIYDYITVCDTSNNTPSRIDRSELWVDIAIEPVKAVEFIYIPLRLVNTGAIAAGAKA